MEDWEWNDAQQIHLFDAVISHKPVGISKHFQMYFIWEQITEAVNKDIESDNIWKFLRSFYNLEALDEAEPIPFPNSETEFFLPDAEYEALKAKKIDTADDKKPTKGRETPKLKELRKEERTTPNRGTKEVPRRDSKDGKVASVKKEVKKETEKPKVVKNRSSAGGKEETKGGKGKTDDPTPKVAVKRPTRGSLSLKSDDSSSGKSSPQTVTQPKRRRI